MNTQYLHTFLLITAIVSLNLIFPACDGNEGFIYIEPPVDTTTTAVMMYSTDDGLSWDVKYLRTANKLNSFTELHDSLYFTAGYTTTVGAVMLVDLDENWPASAASSFIDEFKSLKTINGQKLIAVCNKNDPIGMEGVVLSSNGVHFQNTLVTRGLTSTAILSPNEIVCTGELALIYRSTDEGGTWQRIIAPEGTSDLYDVDFYGSIGLAVGKLGTILRTTDRGVSWEKITGVPTQQTLKAVLLIDNNTMITVGSSGTILKSTNGGQSWRIIETLGNYFFTDIEYNYTSSTLILIGSSGAIMRSTDLGENWLNNSEVTERHLHGIYLDNKGNWHIVGE